MSNIFANVYWTWRCVWFTCRALRNTEDDDEAFVATTVQPTPELFDADDSSDDDDVRAAAADDNASDDEAPASDEEEGDIVEQIEAEKMKGSNHRQINIFCFRYCTYSLFHVYHNF